ncbi:HAAAP family serine/threonine permease [Yersinia enterocolitica]|nr:HAAAP family serine/threonine permease [Yersinia enterocolitica]HDL7900755.1 HAAAP family serine/threonine permease [Yersinia enterocolitica]HDL7912875.1 HAAAP family serine/threonine permease [Yersinia enterocolitica]
MKPTNQRLRRDRLWKRKKKNESVILIDSPAAKNANMTEREWQEAIKFDSTDFGWVIMSIGMAIGAGIVFLPVQVGLMGLWVFLLSSIIGYPAMYLFQRLFINTLAESPECKDYPSVISGYLGKNWGIVLGALYFIMLVIWMFVYSTAITNDSASYLQTFGVTEGLLSDNPFYGLVLICVLVAISSRGEKLLLKLSSFMVITKLLVVAALGISMVGMWHLYNVGMLPPVGLLIKNAIITLPFTLTSILFIQTLSPMVISYRAKEKSLEVARHKALRAMNIAFGILFCTVFFYAVSFTLAMGHDEAVKAYEQNISALAIAAKFFPGGWATVVSVILNIFAVMTAFFGVYLGFREATQGIVLNILRRIMPPENINERWVQNGIMVFAVLLAWGAIILNAPVLSFTSICSPIFGMVGCLIPAYLVYKVPALHKYKGLSLTVIIITGVLLCISPFLAFS